MSKKRAFTLVELLVVIAIIALLMSILMPALAKAKKQAMMVLDQSNQKQVGVSTSAYIGDSDGLFWKGWGGSEDTSQWWLDVLRPYYSNQVEIRCCPLSANPTDTLHTWNMCGSFQKSRIPLGYCDATKGNKPDYGSYGENGWIENQGEPPLYGQSSWYWRSMDVKGAIAKDVPLFFDEPWIDAWPLSTDNPPDIDWSWNQGGAATMMARVCNNRHDGYINMLFMDLSDRKVGLKELWTLKWHRNFDTCGPWTKCGKVRPNSWPKWMRDFKNF